MTMTRRDLAALPLAGAALLAAGRAGAAGEAGACPPEAAAAEVAAEVHALYARFVAAQNARDLVAVRGLLRDSPDFLWVSDGRPVWGPDALVERMGQFQRAEVWRVEPALDRSRAVALPGGAAFLSVPLVLAIGPAAAPAELRWLVGVLCTREADGWRIAALFTTEDKAAVTAG